MTLHKKNLLCFPSLAKKSLLLSYISVPIKSSYHETTQKSSRTSSKLSLSLMNHKTGRLWYKNKAKSSTASRRKSFCSATKPTPKKCYKTISMCRSITKTSSSAIHFCTTRSYQLTKICNVLQTARTKVNSMQKSDFQLTRSQASIRPKIFPCLRKSQLDWCIRTYKRMVKMARKEKRSCTSIFTESFSFWSIYPTSASWFLNLRPSIRLLSARVIMDF